MQKYIHAFNLVPGTSYLALKKIDKYFTDWRHAWNRASMDDFMRAGLSRDFSGKIANLRPEIDPDIEMEKIWKSDIHLIDRFCSEYPVLLSEIADPPFLIYRKGAPLKHDSRYVAIVGTRIPSDYGKKTAYDIAKNVTECGGVVVSGLAFGIDAVSHLAAVDVGKPTVAVLASGINHVTPTSHIGLARKIVEKGGTIISEYTGGAESFKNLSFKYRFLERNRIISGLCKSTIVIEAKQRSGALITAHHAFDQNRDVYTLMGDINRPQAQGCLNLIANDAAVPIVNLDKLMVDLGFNREESVVKTLDINSVLVLGLIKKQHQTVLYIIEKSELEASEVNCALSILELKNLITQNREGKWQTK